MEIKAKAKKIIIKSPELSKVVRSTMKTLSDLVGVTLGPGGNTVLIERVGMPPLTTKDGVTVAESAAFQDATQHTIAEAAKEVCQRTNRQAGDGTTTAIVLANAILEEGQKFLENNTLCSPQQIGRELKSMVETLSEFLEKKAIVCNNSKSIYDVAMISSNSDEDVAKAVVEAIDLVGEDGTIITDEGSQRNTVVEMKEGFLVEKGLAAFGPVQELFMNNQHDQECVYDTPYILLYDGDVNVVQPVALFLQSCLNKMKEEGGIRPIVIVAHKFAPMVVKLFAENIKMNTINLCMLETAASGQANSRHHLLHDLAAFTSAKVLDPITNTFDKGNLSDLGVCGKVRIGRYKSVFLETGDEAPIQERIETLKRQMTNAESDFDAELIKERIGKLSGGIATIFVGGSTDLEIREKKHRIEDTINAVRSAIEMGVLPGGGSSLLTAANWLGSQRENLPPSHVILTRALAVPFMKVMENAGSNMEIAEALQKVSDSVDMEIGLPMLVYDSLKHTYVNPLSAGIIDPAKVTITALNNALSIALMLMTIGGTVVIPRDASDEAKAELMAQSFAQQMQGA